MRYFDFRLRAIRNIINSVKGFIRTITGVNSVTLDNCVDDDSLTGLKIYGNSVQDGTPAPDSPVEIQSVGELVTDESDEHYGKYKIPIKARGKNLFDINSSSLLSGTIRGTLEKIDNGFKCTCTNTYEYFRIALAFPKSIFTVGKAYSVSFDGSNIKNARVGQASSITDTSATSKYANSNTFPFSFTYSEEASTDYILILLYAESYETGDVIQVENIQIEEGSDATDYEAYHEQKTFNIWANEPIRKFESALEALNVSDCLDVKNRCIVRNVYEEVINGTVAGDWSDTYAPTIIYNKTLPAALSYSITGERTFIISNYSVGKSQYVWFANATHNKVALGTNLYGGTTEDELIAFIEKCNNTQPFKVFYPLLEPIEEKISIPYLPIFKGTTIYEIETSIPTSSVEVQYYSSVSDE